MKNNLLVLFIILTFIMIANIYFSYKQPVNVKVKIKNLVFWSFILLICVLFLVLIFKQP